MASVTCGEPSATATSEPGRSRPLCCSPYTPLGERFLLLQRLRAPQPGALRPRPSGPAGLSARARDGLSAMQSARASKSITKVSEPRV